MTIYMLYSWVRTPLNFGHSEFFEHPTYILIVSRMHFGPLTNERKTQIDKLNPLFLSCFLSTMEQICSHLIQVLPFKYNQRYGLTTKLYHFK